MQNQITVEVTVKANGTAIYTAQLEQGTSKKGTFVTLAPAAGNKVMPFGKLYLAPDELPKAGKAGKAGK